MKKVVKSAILSFTAVVSAVGITLSSCGGGSSSSSTSSPVASLEKSAVITVSYQVTAFPVNF